MYDVARKHLFLFYLASVPRSFLSAATNKAVLKHHGGGLHELTENLNFDECEILISKHTVALTTQICLTVKQCSDFISSDFKWVCAYEHYIL
jgi:hypothetical protein